MFLSLKQSNFTDKMLSRKKRSKPKAKKSEKKESKHHRTEKSKRVVKPGQHLLKNFSAPNMGGSRLTVRHTCT